MPPADRDWFDTLVGVASVFNTLVITALLLVMVPAVIAVTRNLKQLRGILDKAYDDLKPLTDHANRIAANVDEITESVRDEVKQVKETVGQATRGLHNAVENTERRLRDLGALMDVAQGEAERIVVGTASTAHGVRAGASAMGDDSEDLLDGNEPQRRGTRPQVRSRRKRAG
jgi:ABC-type transporter Mla subunit MlaD